MNKINFSKIIVACDYVPIVSTVSNLVHIFQRVYRQIDYLSQYGRYLNARNITYHILNLIPIVNIFATCFFRQFSNSSLRARPEQSDLTSQELNYRHSPYEAGPTLAGGSVFHSHEIVRGYNPSGISIPYSESLDTIVYHFPGNRHIIFQQAANGCTAGASCMLALDHGKRVNIDVMRVRQPSPITQSELDLLDAGLNLDTTLGEQLYDVQARSFSKMKLAIDLVTKGPCVTAIQDNGANVGHAIVLDAINLQDNTATIRDPWHGWMIDVNLDALILRLNNKVLEDDSGQRIFYTRFIHIANKDVPLVV